MSSLAAPAFPAWKSSSDEFDYYAWRILAGRVYPDTVKLMPEFAPRVAWLGWNFVQASRDGCSWAKELAEYIRDHHQGVLYYKDQVIATVRDEGSNMVFTIDCSVGEDSTVITFQDDGYVTLSQSQDKEDFTARPEHHHFMPYWSFEFISKTLGLDEPLPPSPVVTTALTNASLLHLVHGYARSLDTISHYEAYEDVLFVCVDLIDALCGMRNSEGARALGLGLFVIASRYDGAVAESEQGVWSLSSSHEDIEQTVCLELQGEQGDILQRWLYLPDNKAWTKDGTMTTKQQLRDLDSLVEELDWHTRHEQEPVVKWWKNVSRREGSAN